MKQRKFTLFTKLVIASSLVILLSSPYITKTIAVLPASQVTLKPTDDTYVDSSNPSSNYGGQGYLIIENYQLLGTSYECIVWLKFNLSSVPSGASIDEATLQLFTTVVDETFNVTAYYCSDNDWTELGITWNNYPRIGFIPVDSVLAKTQDQWYNWSVLGAVKYAQVDNSLAAVTIVLAEPNVHSSATMLWFESEAGAQSKKASVYLTNRAASLTIHWTAVTPEFPTLLLIPLTIATTLIATIFYKRKVPHFNA
jgi:hypothetical protein